MSVRYGNFDGTIHFGTGLVPFGNEEVVAASLDQRSIEHLCKPSRIVQ